MTRSRKVFLAGFFLFAGFLAFIVFDISNRTTPPWKKKEKTKAPADTVKSDSSAKSTIQPQ